MNVTEWSCFHGDTVGYAVHLVDAGVDTGDVLCVRVVEIDGVSTIDEARGRVHRAQLALLHDVVKFVTRTGSVAHRRGRRLWMKAVSSSACTAHLSRSSSASSITSDAPTRNRMSQPVRPLRVVHSPLQPGCFQEKN